MPDPEILWVDEERGLRVVDYGSLVCGQRWFVRGKLWESDYEGEALSYALLAAHARIKEAEAVLQEIASNAPAAEPADPIGWRMWVAGKLIAAYFNSPAPDASVGPEFSPRAGPQDDTEEAP